MSFYPIKELLTCGLPVHQRNSSRIWATTYDPSSNRYSGIQYSDDFGETWKAWLMFAPSDPTPNGHELHMDTDGNFYFSSDASAFIKVDGKTRQIGKAFDFYPYAGLYGGVPNPGQPTRAFVWSFTEDNGGYLFVGQYQLWRETGGQYIWRYNPSSHWDQSRSNQWEMLDYFVVAEPRCRHIHAVHANPYNNKLYVSMGDFYDGAGNPPGSGKPYKRFYVSGDQLRTATLIPDPPDGRQYLTGYTALTFTSERVYVGDDLVQKYVNGKVGLWSVDPATDGHPAEFVWSPADVGNPELGVPLYYARALRDNPDELWLSFVNDGNYQGCSTGIVVLKKQSGTLGPWTPANIWKDPVYQYYDISQDGQGVTSPGAHYIFVGLVDWNNVNPSQPWKVLRIDRT